MYFLIKHKKRRNEYAVFYCLVLLLRFFDCADGATVLTCSAIDALLGIDNVFAVAFCDCSDRASICARTALDALIADNSGHSFISLQNYIRFRLQLYYHTALFLTSHKKDFAQYILLKADTFQICTTQLELGARRISCFLLS